MNIKVCTGKACSDKYSKYIISRIKRDKEKFNLDNIEIEETACMGMCDKAPNVKIDNKVFNRTNPIKISENILKK